MGEWRLKDRSSEQNYESCKSRCMMNNLRLARERRNFLVKSERGRRKKILLEKRVFTLCLVSNKADGIKVGKRLFTWWVPTQNMKTISSNHTANVMSKLFSISQQWLKWWDWLWWRRIWANHITQHSGSRNQSSLLRRQEIINCDKTKSTYGSPTSWPISWMGNEPGHVDCWSLNDCQHYLEEKYILSSQYRCNYLRVCTLMAKKLGFRWFSGSWRFFGSLFIVFLWFSKTSKQPNIKNHKKTMK